MPPTAHDVAAALRASYSGRLQPGKLHKLLYYCQGHHLAVFDKPLFPETLEAWDDGPVVPSLWYAEQHNPPAGDPATLNTAELNTVGYTLHRYGNLTGTDLRILSRGEDPWMAATRDRPAGGAPIDPEAITRYFRANASTVREEYPMDRATISAWLQETAPRTQGAPGQPRTRDELATEFAHTRAGRGD